MPQKVCVRLDKLRDLCYHKEKLNRKKRHEISPILLSDGIGCFVSFFVYNTVLANGTFTNRTFLDALTHMWVEYGIIFLLAFFVAGAIAPKLAFWVVQPGDRPICIVFAIQTFTVILMVAFASVIGLFHAHGFSANVIPNYIVTYCKNFIIALPLQLILVGPLARFLFRHTLLKCRKDV